METRKKIEIIVAIIVLIVFIVALVMFVSKTTPDQQIVVDDASGQLDTSGDRGSQVSEVDPADIPSVSAVSASTIARTFVERFGSYSSEVDFMNVEDVLSLATEDFEDELTGIIERARRNADDAYYGISTVVITTKVVKQTDSTATLRMTTQREEAIDDPANTTVRYQDIVIELVKDGDDWLIDGFTWQ